MTLSNPFSVRQSSVGWGAAPPAAAAAPAARAAALDSLVAERTLQREVERELGIGRVQAMDLVRIVKIFQRDAAEEISAYLKGAMR